jgi:desulfoferrodoxin (superoxide reductase-like protein)
LDIEIEHIPQYQITSEGYTVCIGDEDVFHENTDEHQLYQIIVCQRDTHEIVAHLENPRIAEIFLLPGEFTFEEHELYTVCNQHGIWK